VSTPHHWKERESVECSGGRLIIEFPGLRIHDATEKGDNESIKKAQRSLGKTPGSPGPSKCCSA